MICRVARLRQRIWEWKSLYVECYQVVAVWREGV